MNFQGHYAGWRNKRISKIQNIFGKSFFKNKKILELGCGLGDIGIHFKSLGAHVTFAEGRHNNILEFNQKYPLEKIIELNQNDAWSLNEKFHIIIHWGVLYHLDNWQQDLKSALNHTNLLFLESEVSDSDDPNFEIKVDEESEKYDQSLTGKGSRPSAQYIEKVLSECGATFTRYDDAN